MWVGPEKVLRSSDMISSVPWEGGCIDESMELHSEIPTLWMSCSSGPNPCVYSFPLRLPLAARCVSWKAVISMFCLASSRLMIAVFLVWLTCWRSSESPGLMVLTFQIANRRVWSFVLFEFLSGAKWRPWL